MVYVGGLAVWRAVFSSAESVAGGASRSLGESEPAFPIIQTLGSFQLTNQFGVNVDRESLEGYVWVASVIFSRCPGLCHELSQQMRRIQDRLPAGASVRLISLTADPEYDTFEVLARYAKRYGANGSLWNFLTGPKPDVYELAIEGLKFSVLETAESQRSNINDLFIHSSLFAIVDHQGRLRTVVQGEEPDAEDQVLARVERLLKEIK